MADPRATNCQASHIDASGQVDGVLLEYREVPESKYALVRVELVPESQAAGQTVANCTVLDKAGIQVGETVYLAWPWPSLANWGRPGNPNNQHMIVNGFDAAKGVIGPLALYVGDARAGVISDVIGGLGLPNNRHVCYRATWRERGAIVPPGGGGDEYTDILIDLDRIDAKLDKVLQHLGIV